MTPLDNPILFASELLAIFITAAAAWFVYEVYKFNRSSKGWLALVLFLVVAVVRISYVFASDFGYLIEISRPLRSIDQYTLLLLNILQIIGFYSMLKDFKQFDQLQETIRRKLKSKKK